MSMLIAGTVSLTAGFITPNDMRLHSQEFTVRVRMLESTTMGGDFTDGQLWPAPRGMNGTLAAMLSNDATYDSQWAAYPWDPGGQTQLKIRGTTRDAAAAPLGSCTVQAFLTATDAYVGQTVSDTGGYFEMPTPYVGQQHYLVAYKGGGPDVAGTTLNTLTPS